MYHYSQLQFYPVNLAIVTVSGRMDRLKQSWVGGASSLDSDF